MINVQLYGDKFIDLTDEITEETRAPVMQMARNAGRALLFEVRSLLRRHAHVYGPLLPGQTRARSSPPGLPPAYQKGDLYHSFKLLNTRVKENTVTSGIKTDQGAKANSLEYGEVLADGTHVPPRPYMRPAEEAVQKFIDADAATLL